ncbi:hypothetical protein ACIOC1_19635 [Streptomyces sp. NPDC088197]|uniref:hypothetical protein n=1 Tax=unclassified Streptomyces TaxID=2593676 RepID=UPI0033B8C3DC
MEVSELPYDLTIYLAHRDDYADFLTATDEEASVVWHRRQGDHTDRADLLERTEAAYGRTQAALNVLDIEGGGPLTEAKALVGRIRSFYDMDEIPDSAWEEYKAARSRYVTAARESLAAH